MPASNPCDLSIAEAGAALRNGGLTSVTLTRAHLDRIAARDGAIGAFVHAAGAEALAAAELADRDLAEGRDRGPLHGIPFAVKDIIDVAGWPIRWGSRAQAGRIATETAPAVAALMAAGAVPLGVVGTYEMATVGPDGSALGRPPVNPWSRDHITGGSSSGSAAAVAAGLVRIALGTDTGGSVRSPSAYCGVVGLKPTYDAVSREGVMPLSPSLDCVGPLARCVGDAALAFAVLTSGDWQTGSIDGLSLAYGRSWAIDDAAHPALLPLLDDAASVLSLCGARITPVVLPDYAPVESAGSDILLAEGWAAHAATVEANPEAIGDMARASLCGGKLVPPERLAKARASVAPLTEALDAVFAQHAALILPTTLAPAPPFSAFAAGQAVWTAMRTIPFNMTGHPALSVPMGFADGLPLGLQIVGPKGGEATILRIGAAFEAATDHSVLQPPLA
ncbi:amidase family protein [Mameliella alba]|uniref:amidase family protein n=1 Tax=Mameliella alba TaxID=561184 RepID=UPI001430688F